MAVRSGRVLTVVVGMLVMLWSGTASALKFGPKDALDVRGKVYTQYTVATEESQEYTLPEINPGDMKQWRTFYNPEFEVDFRRLVGVRHLGRRARGPSRGLGLLRRDLRLGPDATRRTCSGRRTPATRSAPTRRRPSTRGDARSPRPSRTADSAATAASSTDAGCA